MATFRYLAKRGPQDLVEGVLEAQDRASVLTHLVGLGFTPVQVDEASLAAAGAPSKGKVSLGSEKIPFRALNTLTRQFASLIRSQVPLLRALRILEEQTPHPKLKRIIANLAEDIRQGQTLSEALTRYPKVFSPLYVSLTRSGEAAGMLDTVLDRLAMQADRDEALRSTMQSALTYPLFVVVVGVGTVLFLLTFVMPRMVKLFVAFRGHLPLPTRILLALTDLCRNEWFWIGAAVVGAVVFVLTRGLGEKGWLFWDRLVLRLPLLGGLTRQAELARFARSFGLLLDHGINILQAAEIAIPVVHNRVIRKGFSRLPSLLKEGHPLSATLRGFPAVTPFLVNTVAVGEENGKVGEALMEVANFYDQEVERLLNAMAVLVEPAVILVVGAVVGFIVMAVLLPIFEMSSIVR